MPCSPGAGATSCLWAISFFMGETHIAPASVQARSQHPCIILPPPQVLNQDNCCVAFCTPPPPLVPVSSTGL